METGERGHFAIVDDIERNAAPFLLQLEEEAADACIERSPRDGADRANRRGLSLLT